MRLVTICYRRQTFYSTLCANASFSPRVNRDRGDGGTRRYSSPATEMIQYVHFYPIFVSRICGLIRATSQYIRNKCAIPDVITKRARKDCFRSLTRVVLDSFYPLCKIKLKIELPCYCIYILGMGVSW